MEISKTYFTQKDQKLKEESIIIIDRYNFPFSINFKFPFSKTTDIFIISNFKEKFLF